MLRNSQVALLACGSFNPPTIMHLRMMEVAKDYLERECGAKVLVGVLSPVADHFGKPNLLPAQHRLKMVDLAVKGNFWLESSGYECGLSRWSTTLSILRHHKETLTKRFADNELKLFLVCGGDMADSFLRILPDGSNLWKPEDVESIIRDFGLVIINREGASPAKTLERIPAAKTYTDNIVMVSDEACPNDISSTRLRSVLQRGGSVRYCTPDPVIDYIAQNKLFH